MTRDDEQFGYRFARALLRPPLMALTRRDWRGQENIPATGGCVLVVNHVSHADPLTFAHFVNDAGRAPRFLGKNTIFEVPVVGSIIRSAGQIPVYRETQDATHALRAAVTAVEQGECVVVYPEATLTRDPGLWPMVGKTGAARIALRTGCPVVPCAQWGPQHLLAPYARWPRPIPRKTMSTWAGPPVELDDLAGQEQSAMLLRAATSRIMTAIVSLLEQIRGDDAPTELFDPRDHQLPRIGNPRKANRRQRKGSH